MRKTVFIILLMLTLPAAAAGEDRAGSVDALMEKSGLKHQIEQIPAQMRQQIELMEQQGGPMPPDRKGALINTIPQVYHPPKLIGEVAQGVEQELTKEERKQILAFLDSPLGQKVIAAEKAMGSPDAMMRLEQEGPEITEQLMKDNTRLALIQSLDKATRGTDQATDIALATGLATEYAMITLSDMPEKPSFEEVREFYEQNRLPMRMQMAQMITAGYAMSYKDLSNDELTEYLSFANSDAGQRYFLGIGKVMAKVLTNAAAELGRKLAEAEKQPI